VNKSSNTRPAWFAVGDINGFFGLAFDNLTVLSFMAAILIGAFGFPSEIVFQKMFPGTALGVLVGDLIYTAMAIRLSRQTGRAVTAMPLGLDTPSSIGLSFTVLGPAFLALKAKGLSPEAAALEAWHLGMATMVLSGILKFALSFAGGWIQRVVPQAALLGSLAGVGLALIGFLPLVETFSIPLIGMLSLGLILYSLVARMPLPRNFPSVLAAILIGTTLYYILAPMGLIGGHYEAPKLDLHLGFPWPTLAFMEGMSPALQYLPISLPFALITVVGGIDNSESARVAGDTYNTRDILLTEAAATMVAGACGGVAQTTPYIGHPAYKQMGCRAGYTLLTGVFIGLGGILGYTSFIVELIPRAVIAPILIFVAIEITCQAFMAGPRRYAPAVVMTLLPTIANLIVIKLNNPNLVPPERFQAMLKAPGKELPDLLLIVALGNGFILTSMLWGSITAHLIDRKVRAAVVYTLICAGCAYFGLIHSALPDGNMYFPWNLPPMARSLVNQFTVGYLAVAFLFFALHQFNPKNLPIEEPNEI
jgi:AGZA family xanthine/uracil permease-like MFS transporter